MGEIHAAEIRDYLKLLDLVVEIEIRHSPNVSQRETVEAITQPGMRYVQAEELIRGIVADSVFQEAEK